MDADDAMKTLASVQMARDHASRGRHGAATALLMKVCLVAGLNPSRPGGRLLAFRLPAVLLLPQM